jgi:hypothetical protein
MIRNLPCGLSCQDLLRLVNGKQFAGLYDFVYMPFDFKRGLCLGYAFLNLISEYYAERFMAVFHGFSRWYLRSSKVCAVTWSLTQGLEDNIERYRNSPVMGDDVPAEYKPMLFVDQQQVPFPEPTRRLPKLHRR